MTLLMSFSHHGVFMLAIIGPDSPSGHRPMTCWAHLTSLVAFSEAIEALTASNSSKNAASLCNALICTPSTATLSSKATSSFTLGLSCTCALL